jgi:uncharacterized protein YkwD
MMTVLKHTLLLSLTLIVEMAQASVFESSDLAQAYAYLNQIRIKAGLTEFSQNAQLEIAAFNHANYLTNNLIIGHYENQGIFGFTGVYPKDRTMNAGYRSSLVSENVSSGNVNSIDSIEKLMGAIYHRFGFLDFVHDEVGIGIAQISLESPNSIYTYNMGNTEYNALCEGPAFSGTGYYYFNVCEPNIKIDATAFEKVKEKAMGNNPNIVVWPVNNDEEVPPAFFEEIPDPLPDYAVSGNPISIQFNPLVFTTVNITRFELYVEPDNSQVHPTRLLTQSTDPNKKMSNLQYALFPLKRLEWNTAYRVEVEYTSNLGEETVIWHFKTRDLGVPLFTVQGDNEEILISSDIFTFVVYVPPTVTFPKIGRINYLFPSKTAVETLFEDGNTLWINLLGEIDQEIRFNFSGERQFVVKIRDKSLSEESVSVEENLGICEPAIFSANVLHIPALYYTHSPDAKPIVLWVNLERIGEDLFHVTHFGLKKNAEEPCETAATLSPNMDLHIYLVPEELTILFPNWRDNSKQMVLQHKGHLQFQITADSFSPMTPSLADKTVPSDQNKTGSNRYNFYNLYIILTLLLILGIIAVVIYFGRA